MLDFLKSKEEEFKKFEDEKNAEQATFDGKADMTQLLNDATKFRETIETGHVELQHLQIKISELEEGTEMLTKQKEESDRAKK